jgi:hypothetical protein
MKDWLIIILCFAFGIAVAAVLAFCCRHIFVHHHSHSKTLRSRRLDARSRKFERARSIVSALKMGGSPGGCTADGGNVAACPAATNSPLQAVQAPISDPADWLAQFILNFPLYSGQVETTETDPDLFFIPWNPTDVVGNNDAANDMNIYVGTEGLENTNLYMYSGVNYDVSNNEQAREEYGPGWTAGQLGGCNYSVSPYNEENGAVTKDAIMNGFRAILGPQNPAFKNTNGWIVVGYDSVLLTENKLPDCVYFCSIGGLNNGAGIFYFDQVRKAMGLPLSK